MDAFILHCALTTHASCHDQAEKATERETRCVYTDVHLALLVVTQSPSEKPGTKAISLNTEAALRIFPV